MLKKMYNAVYAAFKWSKAYDRAVAGDYQGAYYTLKEAYRSLQIGENYGKALYDFNLLFGWLLLKNEKFGDSIKVFIVAKDQIADATSLSRTDKDYLNSFCNWNIRYAAEKSGNYLIFAHNRFQENFDFSKLSNVTPRLAQAFPLQRAKLSTVELQNNSIASRT